MFPMRHNPQSVGVSAVKSSLCQWLISRSEDGLLYVAAAHDAA